jgi:hypothetical protein
MDRRDALHGLRDEPTTVQDALHALPLSRYALRDAPSGRPLAPTGKT